MSTVVLTGVSAGERIPGVYLQTNFAQGLSSLGSNVYPVVFIGNKTSAGSATVDTVVYGPRNGLTTEADAKTLFGTGSELHRMIRQFLKTNKSTPFYALAVTESAGAAATRDHVISGTATSDGYARFFVGDEFVDVPIANGDGASAIASAAATANTGYINTRTHWPVTASVVTSTTVRLTANQKGLRGNLIRSGVQVYGATGISITNGAQGYLASGTTADSNTAALATIAASRYYYICSAANDSTQLGALVSQVQNQALPITGIRQRVIAASNESIGTASTLSTTQATRERAEIVWLNQCDWEPPVMAAHNVAAYTLEEASFPFLVNWGNYDTPGIWEMPAPRSGAAPTRANINAALNAGLSPVGVNANGTTYLVDRVTTRTLDGSVPDYRIADASKVTVIDRFADDLVGRLQRFKGKQIADDPPPNAQPPGPRVATPSIVKATVVQLLREYANVDMIQNVDEVIAATDVFRETSPAVRMSIRIPFQTPDGLKQFAVALDQVA